MQLLRSEEHLERWRRERDLPEGATLTPEQQWGLSAAWYRHRLEPDWRRATLAEATAIFDRCGLTGDFWSLA